MSHKQKTQKFKEKFKKFKEFYSLTNKDPNLLDYKTLEESIKHENISLVLDILSISVFSVIFYFIVRYQLVLIPFSNTYTFFTIQRDFAILMGYIFSWINIIFMIIGLFREFLFMSKIIERYNPTKKIKLTVQNSEKNNVELSSNLKNQKVVKKLGDIETDKPIIKYLIFSAIIIIIVLEMSYYLPFETRFPHYNEPFPGVGQIYTSEYLIFLVIMLVFAVSKAFLIIMNIMGTIHRKAIFNEVLYIRVQNDYFKELESKKQPESVTIEKTPVQQLVSITNNKITENQSVVEYSEKINILNTPIEMVKLYNLKRLQIKKQIAYLKEREALLNMMNEEKLRNLYGKKGYKKYRKEIKRSEKFSKQTKTEGLETSSSNLYGYKMVDQSQINTNVDSDKSKKEELKKSSKEKGKIAKERSKKEKYDFR